MGGGLSQVYASVFGMYLQSAGGFAFSLLKNSLWDSERPLQFRLCACMFLIGRTDAELKKLT